MANRTLEMLLNKVEVKETGARGKKGRHMVIATLVWPRPRIAERVYAKTVELEENAVDLKKADWITRIVFKELVDGPFGIELKVTEAMSDSAIADFFRGVGSALMKLTGNEAEDMMASSLAGGLVKMPFQYLSQYISGLGDKAPKIIASGSLCLHADETWNPPSGKASGAKTKKNPERKTFKVSLTAPETIYKVTRTRRQGRLQTKKRKLLDAGSENGIVEFTGTVGR
jgi:hypothetical protein